MKFNWTNLLLFISVVLLIILIVKQFKSDGFSNIDKCSSLSYIDCLANSGSCTYNGILKQCQDPTTTPTTIIQTIPKIIQTIPATIQTQLMKTFSTESPILNMSSQFKQFQNALQNPTTPENQQTIATLMNQAKSLPLNVQQQVKSYIQTLPQNQQQFIIPFVTF